MYKIYFGLQGGKDLEKKFDLRLQTGASLQNLYGSESGVGSSDVELAAAEEAVPIRLLKNFFPPGRDEGIISSLALRFPEKDKRSIKTTA